MQEPHKIQGKFLTALETAEVLGVSRTRAEHLISMVHASRSVSRRKQKSNGTGKRSKAAPAAAISPAGSTPTRRSRIKRSTAAKRAASTTNSAKSASKKADSKPYASKKASSANKAGDR